MKTKKYVEIYRWLPGVEMRHPKPVDLRKSINTNHIDYCGCMN